MTHQKAELVQHGEIIGFLEWNDTVDQLWSCKICETRQELDSLWRKHDGWHECTCGGEHDDAILVIGNEVVGFNHWPIKVCLNCRCVTAHRTMDEVHETFTKCGTCGETIGIGCMNFSHEYEWPRRGHPLEDQKQS